MRGEHTSCSARACAGEAVQACGRAGAVPKLRFATVACRGLIPRSPAAQGDSPLRSHPEGREGVSSYATCSMCSDCQRRVVGLGKEKGGRVGLGDRTRHETLGTTATLPLPREATPTSHAGAKPAKRTGCHATHTTVVLSFEGEQRAARGAFAGAHLSQHSMPPPPSTVTCNCEPRQLRRARACSPSQGPTPARLQQKAMKV
jgi:hypothetical protein